ncbi:MAG: molybdopterin cofactor-binding domain-containing protein [Pseudomonadota bacterium]
MTIADHISRRKLLIAAGVVGGGLVVGVNLSRDRETNLPDAVVDGALVPSAFLQVRPDSTIHFYVPSREMGQGVWTGLTTLIAEELSTPPERISIDHSPVHKDFVNPEMGIEVTAGSTAMKAFYRPIRQTAANLRELLRKAASIDLDIDLSAVQLTDGKIRALDRDHEFGAFVKRASSIELIQDAPLKAQSEFVYIGKHNARLDALAKATGTAEFGIDVDIPGMRKAVIKRCPVFGGAPTYGNEATVRSMKGVEAIEKLDHGVAVVADTYWNARRAADALKINWEKPFLSHLDTADLTHEMAMALKKKKGKKGEKRGKGARALKRAEKTYAATYHFPYLAHAMMEPLNCAARIENGKCDIWVGIQSNQIARDCAARYSGLPKENVRVHPTFLGGGFGRRAYIDNVAETVQLAAATGLPVQVMWSREDDIQHDYYRPASVVKTTAGVNESGEISAWLAERAGANIRPYLTDLVIDAVTAGAVPLSVADWASKRLYGVFENIVVDPTSTEGLVEDYDFPNMEVRHVSVDAGQAVGFWRSVGHSSNAFAKETLVDEIAIDLGIDPVDMRLRNAQKNPRLKAVVELAAAKSGWRRPPPAGRYRGFAVHNTYGTRVAQVAEISVEDGLISVRRVICAVDCGVVVNPDIVRAQMESGIIFGITAALYGKIDFDNGAVVQSNFHDYPVLRINESPEIEVHLIESDDEPSGVGEPGLPPIAPAIANAVFAATGERLRTLPLEIRG